MSMLTSHPPIVSAAPGPCPLAGTAGQAATPVRVGIVGAGGIAGYHLTVLRALENVQVVGACDPNAKRLDALCRQWQLPPGAASLDELVTRYKPDVVHLLVPPPYHFDLAQQALGAGLHVLVEKPLALRATQCERLIHLAQKKGLHLGVNHNAIYHPLFQRLLRDIALRKLGRIEHVVSTNNLPLAQLASGDHDHWMFREPANVLFEQGPHPVSQICALLGRVRGVATRVTGEQTLRGGQKFLGAWQLAWACAGGTADLFLSFGRSFPEARLHVIGQDGSVQIDLLNNVYVLDRRTRYLEPVDRLLRGLNQARQAATSAVGAFAGYALSTLRLIGRSDPYFQSMQGSIAAFYAALRAEPRSACSATNGRFVIEGLELAAKDLPTVSESGRLASVAKPGTPAVPPRTGGVLLLGGSGFIGRRLVRALADAGHPVRLLARRPSLLPPEVRSAAVEVYTGDIRQPDEVRRAVEGCAAVVHLVSGAPDTWTGFEKLFIDGARHAAEACLAEGTRLFFASSIAAYYLGKRRAVITEATPLDPYPQRRAAYTRAKIACERLLTQLYEARGLKVTIFRPGVVVGAGGPVEHLGVGDWPTVTHCISWGKSVNHPLPFVLADDVAAAFVKALETPSLEGRSFNLVGDVRLTAAEYIELLRTESDRDIRLHRCSLWQWWLGDFCKWVIKAAARRPENAFPGLRDLASRSLMSAFDCSAARDVLGWRPVADREEFIERGIRQALRGDAS